MPAHQHKWREVFWTLSGALSIRWECYTCVLGSMLRPNKRKRAVPKGMDPERWEQYKLVAEDPELLEAFRARLRTASSRQLGDAYTRNILCPLPTLDNLREYRARTENRAAKKAA